MPLRIPNQLPAIELLKKENGERFRSGMFHGFDTDATMLRIGAMNLMLHGVDNPNIEYRNRCHLQHSS